MQRRIVGPAVIWILLACGVVWIIVRYGAGPVTAVSGVTLALLTAAPFAPAVRRWWLRSGAPSTTSQIDEAALVLRDAVRRQWTEEAGRRHQFAEEDRMAVRWEVVSRPAPRGGEEPPLPHSGSIDVLLEAYAARAWPMIVVGAAGSGKTGLCVLLTLELAKKESQQRIPVLFQLASWDPAVDFERWLLGRLDEDYPFLADESRWGATAAQDLLAGGRLLPILDGLDELSEETRGVVLRTVRESPVFVSPFVLTSRTGEFTQAAGRRTVGGKTVLRLLPIDRSAMTAYLRDVFSTDVERWLPVLGEVARHPDGVLATTLTKPLMLFLARTSYEGPECEPAELSTRAGPARSSCSNTTCSTGSCRPCSNGAPPRRAGTRRARPVAGARATPKPRWRSSPGTCAPSARTGTGVPPI
ncbi:NACHT domain-containing protein [Amycolatopsis sp. NPDC049252]|uniref:NACHT domain-containing protein n=1 Tax=Amycolatopsis sp. NPDC049252 TaxID=3363933 RepID=UPI003718DBC1